MRLHHPLPTFLEGAVVRQPCLHLPSISSRVTP
ncbi:unnamed protein product [Acanthoscelides obtectus]|uniref:Uncharacterized protein n=1 Tax=Acanthoscelides obtectus TaxID=200917 RepID=A0A9P0MC63_ACAOB|nr:unnamed protein product [Acanthoscelides obtectus]CAK1682219.1 hypothetical protein AOBTE_LOCUS33492 [Acanthoscelides obtectus]